VMPGQRVLAEYQRTQILRQVVAAKAHSQTSVEFQSTASGGRGPLGIPSPLFGNGAAPGPRSPGPTG
jgi:hypothetical protein